MASKIQASASLYRTIWRWHFYAGLFCIPFVIWLATTGSIFLFKPQIEALIDRPYDHLAVTGDRAAAAAQVSAALAAVPGSTLRAYELPRTAHSAVRVIVSQKGTAIRVYVDPVTLQILKTVPEKKRLMNMIHHLHGELLLGNSGSIVVEFAASWTIVMIVSGLYLWWPRGVRGAAGIVYPRLGRGGRTVWRDLHAVTGLWVSAFALFILISGLPWAKSWGTYFNELREITGTAGKRHDWPIGSPSAAESAAAAGGTKMAGMNMPGMDMPGMDMSDMAMTPQTPAAAGAYAPLDRMIETVAPLDLAYPVTISPPKEPGGDWTAKSDPQNRTRGVDLVLDEKTGAVLSRVDFDQRLPIDRLVAIGVSAHEGQLFGWVNQLVSLLTASGLVLMSISAVVLWWSRRAVGVLGVPHPPQSLRFSLGFIAIIVMFGLFLPLLGGSMIVVALTERLILRRIPRVAEWLGLRPSSVVALRR